MTEALTEEEISLYDRQIRLWGFEAQQRISQSRILLIGISAINMEVAKNLAAAGVAVVLADDHKIDAKPFTPIIPFPTSIDGNTLTHAEAYSLCLKRMNKFVKVETIPMKELETTLQNYCFSSIVFNYKSDLLEQVETALKVKRNIANINSVLVVCTDYSSSGACSVFSTTSDLSADPVLKSDTISNSISEGASDNSVSGRNQAIGMILKEIVHLDAGPTMNHIKKMLREWFHKKEEELPSDPMTASIMGGVIAQQVREYIEKSAKTCPSWNVAIYDRFDTSVTVYDFPKVKASSAGNVSKSETVKEIDIIDD